MLRWNLGQCIERVHADVDIWIEPRRYDGVLDYLVHHNWLEAVKVMPKGTKAQWLAKPVIMRDGHREGALINKSCLYS